jgi:hypothetical protein
MQGQAQDPVEQQQQQQQQQEKRAEEQGPPSPDATIPRRE